MAPSTIVAVLLVACALSLNVGTADRILEGPHRFLVSSTCPTGLYRQSTCSNCGFESGDLSFWTPGTTTTDAGVSSAQVHDGSYAGVVTAGAVNVPQTLSRTFVSVSPGATLKMWAGFSDYDFTSNPDTGSLVITASGGGGPPETLETWTTSDAVVGFAGWEQYAYTNTANTYLDVTVTISATNFFASRVIPFYSSQVWLDSVTVEGGTLCDSNFIEPSGSADPWIVGFSNQRFFFDGEDAKWYSVVSDPIKKLAINMRLSELRGVGTFTDGMGIVVMGSTGITHTIAFTVVVDKDDFSPKCTTEAGTCLGNGAIAFEIDGEVLTEPMHFALAEEGIEIFAVNAPFGCKRIPDAHLHWEEQVAHMKMIEAKDGETGARRALQRRLTEGTTTTTDDSYRTMLGYLMNGERAMFNEDDCAAWVDERLVKGDVFKLTGSLSTIFINTPAFSLRLEYTMNEDESTWAKHHRFDWFLGGYTPFENGAGGASVGGVLGETGVIKHDRAGQAILGDRYSILSSPNDADYEVEGPYGQHFVAMP